LLSRIAEWLVRLALVHLNEVGDEARDHPHHKSLKRMRLTRHDAQ
jgi:hypothetical protein